MLLNVLSRRGFAVGLLVAANLAALFLVSGPFDVSTTVAKDSHRHTHGLPILELRTANGETINTKRYLGAPVFVQFVNPHVEAQLDSLKQVRGVPIQQPLAWLLITNDATELKRRLAESAALSGDVVLVENGYRELRQSFGLPACCEKWLLFDGTGRLRDSDYSSESGTGMRVKGIVDGYGSYSPAVLEESIRSLTGSALSRLRAKSRTDASSAKMVIAMFSKVCTSCPTGDLVDTLNSHAKRADGIKYMALLPNRFSHDDVRNFRVNLDMAFPIDLADGEFSRRWELLIRRYGETAVNGSVIVFDKGDVTVVQGVPNVKRRLEQLSRSVQ